MTISKIVQGSIFLALVVIIWVGSACLIKYILTDGSIDFNKPLFLTYFCTSFFTLYLIPLAFKYIKAKLLKDVKSLEKMRNKVRGII